jgi:hypothetical protein
MREVLEKFDFDNTISKLADAGLLFQVLERFFAAPRPQAASQEAGGTGKSPV